MTSWKNVKIFVGIQILMMETILLLMLWMEMKTKHMSLKWHLLTCAQSAKECKKTYMKSGLHEAASKEQGITAKYSAEWKEFERYTDALPQEAWIS